MGDGTGLAEALLQLEGFRVLGVHETLAEVVIELGDVRAGRSRYVPAAGASGC